MTPTEFLLKIYKVQCKPGEFIALSTKDDASVKDSPWKDYIFPYDENLEQNLDNWFEKHSDKDKYFCPLPFTGSRRSKALVARSHYLWSDIDEGNHGLCPPSVLWQSSPGRYAGLWKLPKALDPQGAEEGSKSLAYYIGADKGGFDLTQVLRIPGTHNGKYPDHPEVELVRFTDRILREIPQNAIGKWRKVIPPRLLRVIQGKAEVGKRSDMLWKLEHELLDLGIPVSDVFEILKGSDWNKYKGRPDEEERFQAEREKIMEDREEKGSVTEISPSILKVTGYGELMRSIASHPGWLIEGWWQRGSHGIMAGQPKSYKSTIAMDMFFSVAADKPFLGHAVHYGGPVIIVQNENNDAIMKDRWEKIATSKGEVGEAKGKNGKLKVTWARDLPIFMVNQSGFTLDDPQNLVALEEMIQRIRPVAIQLDPLYLMFNGEINSAKELNPMLTWCLYIKQTYNCAVMLIHHYNKGTGEGQRAGQRMLGSTTLHGWTESAIYVQVQEPQGEHSVITVEREFRGASTPEPVDIHLSQGSFGSGEYEMKLVNRLKPGENLEELRETILKILQNHDLQSKSSLARQAGLSRRQVDDLVDKMEGEGVLIKKGQRFGVPR